MAPDDRSLQAPPSQSQTPVAASRPPRRSSIATDKPLSADYYRVKPGDTLYHIAASHGQRSEDIIRWNSLADPAHIETGGVLRVTPPDASKVSKAPTDTQQRNKAPIERDTADGRSQKSVKDSNTRTNDDSKDDKTADTAGTRFVWPARGKLSAVYGQGKSKGLVITAKAGDPVKAAAAGRVVFAGDSGQPYGKLIIVKLDDSLVTAYGHNRKLLVKDGMTIRRGETIAEMAATGHGEGAMQFEVRKDGKPVDPAPWLPRVGS